MGQIYHYYQKNFWSIPFQGHKNKGPQSAKRKLHPYCSKYSDVYLWNDDYFYLHFGYGPGAEGLRMALLLFAKALIAVTVV